LPKSDFFSCSDCFSGPPRTVHASPYSDRISDVVSTMRK
jgi:hypothetical protein